VGGRSGVGRARTGAAERADPVLRGTAAGVDSVCETSERPPARGVLGEVATPSLGLDLLPFAEDEREELRASAARAMSNAEPGLAFEVLNELAKDPVWFVRLRAIISLGRLSDLRAIPSLMQGMRDSNRLVRLRAGEALVELKTEMVPIFQQVIATGDDYGLHAYLTALENADLRGKLEEGIRAGTKIGKEEKNHLLRVLQAGALTEEEAMKTEGVPDQARLQP
jgi:HEAT repeat protein